MSSSQVSRKISVSEWRNQFVTIRDQFRYVFQNDLFCDVKFIVGEKKEIILSHALVLKTRSTVFDKLLEKIHVNSNGMKEIVIGNYEMVVFNQFIQFLYTDELETSNSDETLEILYLAKKYKIQGLSQICASMLKLAINEKNASALFQSARELKEIELEQKACQYIMSNAPTVVQQDDFIDLNQFNLGYLVGRDELEIREIDLFSAILKWAKVECARHKIQVTPKHLRVVLKEALGLIRFPLMSKDDFQSKVVETNVLNERELTELNRYFDADADNKQFVTPVLFSCKSRLYIPHEEQPDLLKQDDESHKRLAKFALKNAKDHNNPSVESATVTVSNVILEIEPKDSSIDLEQLAKEIMNIKKYGLHWGAVNTINSNDETASRRLMISFAADERRSYGVGTVIEEIQDVLGDCVKQVYAKSFRDDIEVLM